MNLLYYALSLNAESLAGDVYLNTFLLGAVEIPANLITLVLMDMKLFGRRRTNSGALFLAGISSLICVPLVITLGG